LDVLMTDPEDNPKQLRKLERNSKGELLAVVDGQEEPIENVKVARCFPWSLGAQYVSIRDKDGKEIVLLRSFDALDEATRRLVEEELRDKFFVPRIRRVTRYKAEFDVVSISAETDRGEVTFQIRNRDDVRLLSPVRALFRDVDGNVYEIEDVTALDRASQKHIGHYF
jgi:hypothetical protein